MPDCRRRLAGLALAILSVSASQAWAQANRPMRTFPQFVGTWALDEAASTGRLNTTPRIALQLTIDTTPETITVTKRPRLGPNDRGPVTPPPEVYRFDGSETRLTDGRTSAVLDVSYRFTLAADMLVLTIKEGRPNVTTGFTLVTDAYAVDGDVLTVHRQLVSVAPGGTIYVMQDPANNSRHTFVYRRVQ
jgi:hypothetical protein